MQVVLDDIGWPLGVKEIFELAGALAQGERSGLGELEQAQCKLQVFARLDEALAFKELFAVRASRHLTSVALNAPFSSHVEGPGVMLPNRGDRARAGNADRPSFSRLEPFDRLGAQQTSRTL